MSIASSIAVLRNPWTLFAAIVIVASVVFGFQWFGLGTGILPPVVLVLLGVLSYWIWRSLYTRSPEFRDAQMQAERNTERANAQALATELRGAGFDQSADHVSMLSSKLDDYLNVVRLKFKENEVSYSRYVGVGQQLYDGAFRNIEAIRASARSIKSIDAGRLESQLRDLGSRGKGDSREAAAIKERYQMYVDQRRQIDGLVEQNEEALTALSNTTTELARIDTTSGDRPDMEAMIEDLKRLADRVDRYGTRIE